MARKRHKRLDAQSAALTITGGDATLKVSRKVTVKGATVELVAHTADDLSAMRAAAAKLEPRPGYLGLIVDHDARTVRRKGHDATASFLRSDKAWPLFRAILDAGADGIDSDRLIELHPDREVNATKTSISRISTELSSLCVRVSDGRKGKRRLESTDAT